MASPDTIQILNAINSSMQQTISTVLARIQSSDSLTGQLINNGTSATISTITGQLNNVNAQINSRLNTLSSQISQNNAVIIQQISAQLQAVQSSLISIQNQSTQRIIGEVNSLIQNNNALQRQLNDRIINDIGQSTTQLQAIIRDSQQRIVSEVTGYLDGVDTGTNGGGSVDRLLVNDIFGGDVLDIGGLLGLLGGTGSAISGSIQGQFEDLVTNIHDQAEKVKDVIDNISNGKYKSLSEMKAAFESIGSNYSIIDLVLTLTQIVPSIVKAGSVLAAPFFTRLEQAAKAQYGLTQLDAGTLTDLYKRKWITQEKYHDGLKALGYKELDASLLVSAAPPAPSLEALRLLFWRGIFSKKQVLDDANLIPISSDDRKAFEASLEQIPGMSDLVSMAVREAFSPEIATKFGQYEDYPQQLTQYARQNGFSEEWSKRYWAAHWQLPSPNMGFEMFQRGIISKQDLTLLLKSLDIMPYWRDKLINLNYSLPTRVDIRRMYGENLITYSEVLKAYKDLGYDDKWSKLLADFAVRYDDEQDAKKQGHIKDLTYSTVETAYKRKIINRNEAYQRLQSLKYIDKDINLLLSLWDYQEYVRTHPDRVSEENDKLADITINAYKRNVIDMGQAIANLVASGYTQDQAKKTLQVADIEDAVADKADYVNLIQRQYLDGMLTPLEVQNNLTGLGFTLPEVQKIMTKLVITRNLSVNRPTKAELTSMAKREIITVDQYRQALRDMNYAEEWIEPLIQLAGLEEDI